MNMNKGGEAENMEMHNLETIGIENKNAVQSTDLPKVYTSIIK